MVQTYNEERLQAIRKSSQIEASNFSVVYLDEHSRDYWWLQHEVQVDKEHQLGVWSL